MALAVPRQALAPSPLPRSVVVGFALLLGGATTAALLPANADFPLTAVMAGIAIGILALTLDSAVWALAPLLIVECTVKYYQFGDPTTSTITLRLVVVMAATILSVALLAQRGLPLLKSRHGLRVMLPAILFVVVATAFDLPRDQPDDVSQYVRYQVTQLMALLLVACVIRRERDVRVIMTLGAVLMFTSAALAIWQYITPTSALYAGLSAHGINNPDQPIHSDGISRAVGLSGSAVQLALTTGVAVPVLFGFLACSSVRARPLRWALWAGMGLLLVGSYLSFTRAAAIAIGAGLAMMGLLLAWEDRLRLWVALGVAGVLFLLLQGTGVIGDRYYAGVHDDKSAASHLVLLEIGTAIAMDNPWLGIGHTEFDNVSTGYAGVASADVSQSGGGVIGTYPPHNDFLLVWISWGLPALAAYAAIFLGAIANCAEAAFRASSAWLRGASVATLGALVSYAVASSFHNYLDTSMLLFLCAGLSIALVQLSAQSPRHAR